MTNVNPSPEIWADIPNYTGIYQISSYGRVKALSRKIIRSLIGECVLKEKLLVQCVNAGYYKIVLHYGSQTKSGKNFLTHRLVAAAFVENPLNLPWVNHKDCNKLNNHFSNLEWCTMQENVDHAVKNGRYKTGQEHHATKLTIEQIKEIQLVKTKRHCNEMLSEKLGVSISTIKKFRKQAHGRKNVEKN